MLAHFGEHAKGPREHHARAFGVGDWRDLVAAEHQPAVGLALVVNQPGLGRLLTQLELAARDFEKRSRWVELSRTE